MISVREFYERFPYPSLDSYVVDGKLREGIGSSYLVGSSAISFDRYPRNVLVAGCGSCEAPLIARTLDRSNVVGVDLSSKSIEISRTISEGFGNVTYHQADLLEWKTDTRFDLVFCTGVLHHVRERKRFLRNLRSLMDDGGWLIGMVYKKRGREHILRKRRDFAGISANSEGVYFVSRQLSELPVTDPARNWYDHHLKTDSEVADTWLNPYAKHYSPNEMRRLLTDTGFGDLVIDYEPWRTNMLFVAKKVEKSR